MTFDAAIRHVVGAPHHGHHGGHGGGRGRGRGGFGGYTVDVVEFDGGEVPSLVELLLRQQGLNAGVIQTGAIERRNPLPVGKYWVDVFEKDGPNFEHWVTKNKGSVFIRATEHFDSDPVRNWYRFETTAPVLWEGPGLPTILEPGVTTSSDTAVRPDPPASAVDQAQSLLEGGASAVWGTFGKGLAWVLGGAIVLELGIGALRKGRK
jgi:hypothetical protein